MRVSCQQLVVLHSFLLVGSGGSNVAARALRRRRTAPAWSPRSRFR